jgi:hypothetical protein
MLAEAEIAIADVHLDRGREGHLAGKLLGEDRSLGVSG